MTGTHSADDLERFRQAVAQCLGLYFDTDKRAFLADVLSRRLMARRWLPARYLMALEQGSLTDEIGVLAQALTVPETYFFRNRNQFRVLAEVAIPLRLVAQRGVKRLRILSVGCASGEEAYSIAMLVRDGVDASWEVSILGVDVNPVVVKKAMQARYSAWAMRETSADIQQRWFKADGRDFVLHRTLRAAVTFETQNLVQRASPVWQPGSYDVVFFRNVLMYFTPEQAQATMARVARALKPGGFLFLGHAETLRGWSDDFDLRHSHETFYYQRKEQLSSKAQPFAAAFPPRAAVPAAAVVADAWVEAIRQASQRVESLTGSARSTATPRPNLRGSERPAATIPLWDLKPALELVGRERFTEALEMIERLPPESGRDARVLLLRAAAYTHGGRFTQAEETCTRLLDIDGSSAGAHYLLALCREVGRDRTRARYHYHVAVYLDASFAMPHLHLGLLAQREGQRVAAQREFARALSLLQREDGSRLLLFGGGFGQQALVTLCRTALQACGGPPLAISRRP